MKNADQNRIGLLLPGKPRGKSVLVVFIFLVLTLTLINCTNDFGIGPVLNNLQPVDSNITSTTAILKGEIQSVGNKLIIEYGIEITNTYFSQSLKKGFTTTPVVGIYQVEFTGLEPNTLYYYRAYALINTAYVNPQTAAHFTTKP